jgi:GNAT superfamily N-acetyltransferase
VGCVFCVRSREATDDETAQLRILLVTPEGRGLGWGGSWSTRTVAFARAAGYRRLVLWTNEPLAAARRIYLERGFRLVDEERHRSFGAELVGQNYVLAL